MFVLFSKSKRFFPKEKQNNKNIGTDSEGNFNVLNKIHITVIVCDGAI